MVNFSTTEFFLYILYPLLLIALSVFVSVSSEMTKEKFFFADRNTNWFILSISLMTSSIISPYLLSLIVDNKTFIFPIFYACISIVMILILGFKIGPKLKELNINTLPEYFEKRFNPAVKYFISTLYILTNLFVRLIVLLIIGNLLIQTLTGSDSYFSLIFFLVVTSLFLIIGGLKAEIYIGALQVALIALVMVTFIFWLLFQGESIQYISEGRSLIEYIHVWSGYQIGWSEMIIGLPLLAFWFWNADQLLVQKLFSISKSEDIKKTSLVTAIMQALPVLIFIVPALLIGTLLSDVNPADALIVLFEEKMLPEYLSVGLLLAGAAGLIASFASILNSTTILVTFDFFSSLKGYASERKLVLIGRLTLIFIMIFSFVLIPIAQSLSLTDCLFLLELLFLIASMILALFILSLVMKNLSSRSAMLSLTLSTILIFVRSIVSLFYQEVSSQNSFMNLFVNTGFIQFSIFVFLFTAGTLFLFHKIFLREVEKPAPVNSPMVLEEIE